MLQASFSKWSSIRDVLVLKKRVMKHCRLRGSTQHLNKRSHKSTALVTVWQYIWGTVGRRGWAPAPAFKRLTLSPQRHRGLWGQAGAWVGRSLVKHWPSWISRHCLVSSCTRAPVSSADTYLGSRSEPIQRLSVPERQRWRCMDPGWGTRHVGPVVVKPKAGQIGQRSPPLNPPFSVCFCALTVTNETHSLPEQQTDTASFPQCGRGQA